MHYFKRLFKSLFNRPSYDGGIQSAPRTARDEKEDTYLVDFRHGFMGTNVVSNGSWTTGTTSITMGELGVHDEPSEGYNIPKGTKVQKIKIKPKDVFDELERIPTTWSLENIDAKIEIMKDKADLVSQTYTKRELNDFVQRLEHRKKLREKDKDKKTFQSYFQQFDTTTDEKIEALLGKYKLVMEEADLFIPEFPDEAIKIMKEFTRKVERVTGKKPVYYVIAEEKDFQKKYERRDPILLAQSPFGFYYHILGAWDTEMIYLPEL